MAEDVCYWDHYVRHCDYGNWHTKSGIELTVWPPAKCVPIGDNNEAIRIDTYKRLKEFYGFNYVKVGLDEDEYKAAIKAGWSIDQLSIWMNRAWGVGTLKWHLSRIYGFAKENGQDINNKSIHSIYLEEPFHNAVDGNWAECVKQLCHGTDAMCMMRYGPRCSIMWRQIIDHVMKYGSQSDVDFLPLDIFTLPYFIKNYLEFNITLADGSIIHIRPNPPNVIAIEYDGYILPSGVGGLDAIINDRYKCNTGEWRDYFSRSGSEIVLNIMDEDSDLECLCEAYRIGYRKLLVFPGPDDRYDNCDQFWRRLNNFYSFLERCGYVEREYNCYPVLSSRWKCKYPPPYCYLRKKDLEHMDDWIWIPIDYQGNTIQAVDQGIIGESEKIYISEQENRHEISSMLGPLTLLGR